MIRKFLHWVYWKHDPVFGVNEPRAIWYFLGFIVQVIHEVRWARKEKKSGAAALVEYRDALAMNTHSLGWDREDFLHDLDQWIEHVRDR